MELLARSFQNPNRRRDVNAPRDPVSSVIDALRSDPNTALFKETLDAEHAKRAPRLFAAEPVAHSALAPLDADPEGECDACGRIGVLALCDVTGIETYACERCRGEVPEEEPPGPQFDAPYQPGDSRVGIFGTRR